MRAIILAAGKGERLNGESGNEPKCLVRAGQVTLIERQIHYLRLSGVADIAVVVGYGSDRVRRACGGSVAYVENEIYERTNSLYSLWLARHLLAEGFIVLNADVLFHPQLLIDLLTARYEDALLVSYCDEAASALGEEEMKVRIRRGRVIEINKTMNPREADGENVGVAKFGPAGAEVLISVMNNIIAAGGLRQWAPRAFLGLTQFRPLHAIGTRGYPWIEIDFPEDYRRAISEVLPGIPDLPKEQTSEARTAAAMIAAD
jgi:choline kinase